MSFYPEMDELDALADEHRARMMAEISLVLEDSRDILEQADDDFEASDDEALEAVLIEFLETLGAA